MFNLFKKKLTPKWSFQKSGTIWLSQFFDDGNMLIEHRTGAPRGQSDRAVSFLLLDSESGKPLWQDFILRTEQGEAQGEGWWIGLELLYNNLFILHGYVAPRIPEHRGLWAIDKISRKLIWKNESVGYVCRVGEELLVSRPLDGDGFAEREFLVLNANTGFDLRKLDNAAADDFRNQADDFAMLQGVILPQRQNEFSPNYNALKLLAQKVSSVKNLVAGIDVIEHDNKTVLGFHEQTEKVVLNQGGAPVKALSYKLLLLENNNVVYDDTLGEQMSGLLTDGFFLRQNRLYYTKERDTLVAVDL